MSDITLTINPAPPIDITLGCGGAPYTEGDGIDITNNVITNTAPNVVQTIAIDGQDLTLSDGGGTVTIPSGSAGDLQAVTDNGNTTDNVIIIDRAEADTRFGQTFSGTQTHILKIEKHPDATSAQITDFNIVRGFFPAVSSAGDNEVFLLGLNVAASGGLEDTAQAEMSIRFENNYRNSSGEAKSFEFHCPQVTYPGGEGRRPISMFLSNDAADLRGSISFESDYLTISDYATGDQKVLWGLSDDSPYAKGITFLDEAAINFQVNNTGGIYYQNAANNATLGLFKVDNLDRAVLGFSGVTTLYTEASLFNSIGPLTISPLASQPLVLGSTSTASDVQIRAVSAVPLILKSSINTNGWGFLVANYGFTIRDMATNADVINIDAACPDRSISIHTGSGNIGIGGYPDYDASLHVKKAGLGAGAKLVRLENSTGGNDFYRSNTTPTGGAAGDLTLTPNGLFVKGSAAWGKATTGTAFTPTSSADTTGDNGDIAYDANFIYIKVGGSWKRSAVSTF